MQTPTHLYIQYHTNSNEHRHRQRLRCTAKHPPVHSASWSTEHGQFDSHPLTPLCHSWQAPGASQPCRGQQSEPRNDHPGKTLGRRWFPGLRWCSAFVHAERSAAVCWRRQHEEEPWPTWGTAWHSTSPWSQLSGGASQWSDQPRMCSASQPSLPETTERPCCESTSSNQYNQNLSNFNSITL